MLVWLAAQLQVVQVVSGTLNSLSYATFSSLPAADGRPLHLFNLLSFAAPIALCHIHHSIITTILQVESSHSFSLCYFYKFAPSIVLTQDWLSPTSSQSLISYLSSLIFHLLSLISHFLHLMSHLQSVISYLSFLSSDVSTHLGILYTLHGHDYKLPNNYSLFCGHVSLPTNHLLINDFSVPLPFHWITTSKLISMFF